MYVDMNKELPIWRALESIDKLKIDRKEKGVKIFMVENTVRFEEVTPDIIEKTGNLATLSAMVLPGMQSSIDTLKRELLRTIDEHAEGMLSFFRQGDANGEDQSS